MAALYLLLKQQPTTQASSPWQSAIGWRMNENAHVSFNLTQGEHSQKVTISQQADAFVVCVADLCLTIKAQLQADELTANISGHQCKVRVSQFADTVSVFIKQHRFDFDYKTIVEVAASDESAGSLKAPMNGTVVAVLVSAGQQVEAGQTLLVMEAMKMEYAIKAPAAGVVNALFYAAGDLVKDGAELVDFTATATAEA